MAAVKVINVVYGEPIALVPPYAVTRYRIDVLGSGGLLAAEGAATIAV